MGVAFDLDEAFNLWATCPAADPARSSSDRTFDSVSDGGWIDGRPRRGARPLELLAGQPPRRVRGAAPARPRRTGADEEWRHIRPQLLLGSAAVAGSLATDEFRCRRNPAGRSAEEVLSAFGRRLLPDAARPRSSRRRRRLRRAAHRAGAGARRRGYPVAAVAGTDGVRRLSIRMTGAARHAGTTPMDRRQTPTAAAAEVTTAVERIAGQYGGRGTVGTLSVAPGLPTVIAHGPSSSGSPAHDPDDLQALARRRRSRRPPRRRGPRLRRRRRVPVPRRSQPSSHRISSRSRRPRSPRTAVARNRCAAAHCTTRRDRATRAGRHAVRPLGGGISHAAAEDTPRDALRTALECYAISWPSSTPTSTSPGGPHVTTRATLPDAFLTQLLSARDPCSTRRTPRSAGGTRRDGADSRSTVTRWATRFARAVPGDARLDLAVFGHIDEIGLVVTTSRTMASALRGVGWDPQVLVGQRVRIEATGGALIGVIGRKPIHLLQEAEKNDRGKLSDLWVDIGATDGDDARTAVAIGDPAVIDAQPVALRNGLLASKAVDEPHWRVHRARSRRATAGSRPHSKRGGSRERPGGDVVRRGRDSGGPAAPRLGIAVDICAGDRRLRRSGESAARARTRSARVRFCTAAPARMRAWWSACGPSPPSTRSPCRSTRRFVTPAPTARRFSAPVLASRRRRGDPLSLCPFAGRDRRAA